MGGEDSDRKVIDIREHPGFRSRRRPAGDDPTREQQDYLQYLDDLHPDPEPADPFDQLESEPKVESKAIPICLDCENARDLRPWYRRYFQAVKASDLFCAASPRVPTEDPITGQPGFLPHGSRVPAAVRPESLDPCLTINCFGTCPRFKPRLVS